jgi:hypothetical protein
MESFVLSWKKWQYVDMKGKNGATTLVEKEGSVRELVIDLLEQLLPWANHTFIAKWQLQQFRTLKENVPNNTLLTVADFPENYRCSFQDEIPSAYYMYSQVTIHPIVCYYLSSEGDLVQEGVVYFSDDLKHDHFAVEVFNEHLYNHLQENRLLSIEKHVQFSDGCPSQYKGRKCFIMFNT